MGKLCCDVMKNLNFIKISLIIVVKFMKKKHTQKHDDENPKQIGSSCSIHFANRSTSIYENGVFFSPGVNTILLLCNILVLTTA